MKLRRRRRKEKEPCHRVLHHHSARPRPEPPLPPALTSSTTISILLSLHPATPLRIPPPQLVCRHVSGEQYPPAVPLPSCPASPFLLHKITEAKERGGVDRGVVPSLPTQLSYSTIAWRCPACPPPLSFHLIGWPRLLSGSNGIFSVAIGAIGKQRPKMNYPVSSPSLTNK